MHQCGTCGEVIHGGDEYLAVAHGRSYMHFCKPCAEREFDVSGVTHDWRSVTPRTPRKILYRVICPYCRKGNTVETMEAAHEWMRTHEHGTFMYALMGHCDVDHDIHPERAIITTVYDRQPSPNASTAAFALADSVAKWVNILSSPETFIDLGQVNCTLCLAYRWRNCSDCPVAVRTGRRHCEGSPYIEWWTHHWLEHDKWQEMTIEPGCTECRRLAQRELDFLSELNEGCDHAGLLQEL